MTTTAEAGPDLRARVGAALEQLGRLAQVHDRPDLAEAATGAHRRLDGTRFRVVVMGEYKRGKSSLINALVDAPACAVDDDLATAARLEVGFADPAVARRWRRDPDDPERQLVADIAPGDAADASTDEDTTLVRLGLPRRLLGTGLVLVDTPGVGGIASAAAVVTASTLADAHAVLFVTDTSQELTRPELDALVDATRRSPNVVVVETKIDLYPHWRDIVATDRAHLAAHGVDVPVVAVSSRARTLALRRQDRDLNAESGFPELVDLIREQLLGRARERVVDDALGTARRVYAHLREPLVEELAVLDTDDRAEAERAVEQARADVEAFRTRVAGWQQTLTDGMTDLVAAVDVDLRQRFRGLVQQAEEELDEADPDQIWHELEPTLYRRTAEALDGNLELLRERADDLAERLAAAVADDEAELLDLGLGDGSDADATGDEPAIDRRDGPSVSSGARAHQAFRAGYGGAMPIMAVGGMALGVLGLGTLVLPLAAVAGVMAGRKALTDERERRLGQRRQQSKLAVKRYTDETLFRATADRKRAQRDVQRALRDHFTQRVKELAATRQQCLQQAETALRTGEQERRQRIATLTEELRRIEDVARAMADGS